jgi:hypothetical protein
VVTVVVKPDHKPVAARHAPQIEFEPAIALVLELLQLRVCLRLAPGAASNAVQLRNPVARSRFFLVDATVS